MKKTLKLVASLVPLTLVLLYGSGYLAQLFRNYQLWQDAGGSLGSRMSPEFPDPAIWKCIGTLFSYPYGLYGLAICIAAALVLIIMIMKMGAGERTTMDRERNLEYSSKGTYGTSGFMTDKELKEKLVLDKVENNDGFILGIYKGKVLFLPKDTFLNRNFAVYGAPGSMKSRSFVRNYVYQAVRRGESIVVTDPKSELYDDLAGYLKKQSYNVVVFNLTSPENSDSWNCISDINGDSFMAQQFTDVVIKNTTVGKGDEFWDSASVNLLKALVLYVSMEFEKENCNFGEAYKLISLISADELDSMFSRLDHTHPAFAPYNIFKQASENVRSGIIIGLGARLQVFQSELIRKITTYDEINLEDVGKKKTALFCITSDQDSAFDFLASLLFAFLFIKLVRYADNFGVNKKLPVPVNFVLDEFPNIGMIPDFPKKIATCRGRGINISCIFQNLAQLQNRYPYDAWQEILGCCDTQIFLGGTDERTAEYIANRTGITTVGVESKTKTLNSWRVSDYTPEYREARSIGKRQVMTPDEVLRLKHEEALVIVRGEKVVKVKKFDCSLHPQYKLNVPSPAVEHVPQWRKPQIEAEKSENEGRKQKENCVNLVEESSAEEYPHSISFSHLQDTLQTKGSKRNADFDSHKSAPEEGGEENAIKPKQTRRSKIDRDSIMK